MIEINEEPQTIPVEAVKQPTILESVKFQCELCGKVFKRAQDLKTHLKKMHAGKVLEVKTTKGTAETIKPLESKENAPIFAEVEGKGKDELLDKLYWQLGDGAYRAKLKAMYGLKGEELRQRLAEFHQEVKEGELKAVIQEVLNKL